MRTKFKILYPEDHPDEEKRGKVFKTKGKDMIVMNNQAFKSCVTKV